MPRFLQALALVSVLNLAFPLAEGAEWSFTESITLSEAFTDNVYLSEDNRESSWATIISPNFLVTGKGRRMEVEVAAALQFVTNADRNFYPRIRGEVHSELVEQKLFLDAHVTAEQVVIDPLRPAGTPINRNGNLTTTYRMGLNPYWLERFGDFADLRLEYRYERELHDGGDIDDRTYNDFYFSLGSGSRFGRLGWLLHGAYERTDYDEHTASNTRFKSLDLRLSYALTRSLSPYLSFGREWNTYDRVVNRKLGGDKWLVGTTWNPNSRIELDVGYGYRFFGYYPFVSLNYRHRRSALRLSYTEDINSGYDRRSIGGILPTVDLAGNPVNPFATASAAGDAPAGVDNLYDTGAYVDRRLTASYLLKGRRNSLKLDLWYSDKNYAEPTPDLLEWEGRVSFSHRLGGGLSAGVHASWNYAESSSGRQADTWDMGFRLSRQLGPFTFLTFNYTHSLRDSNVPGDDYRENRFALVLTTSMVGWWEKYAGY